MPETNPDAPYEPAKAANGMVQELSKAAGSIQQSSSQAVDWIAKAANAASSSAEAEPNASVAASGALASDPELSDNVRSGLLARLHGLGIVPPAPAPNLSEEDQFDQWAFSKGQSLAAPADSNAEPTVQPAAAAQPTKPKPASQPASRPTPPAPKDDPKSWSEWIDNESISSPQERKWGDLLE